jgi:hypothetical protein
MQFGSIGPDGAAEQLNVAAARPESNTLEMGRARAGIFDFMGSPS